MLRVKKDLLDQMFLNDGVKNNRTRLWSSQYFVWSSNNNVQNLNLLNVISDLQVGVTYR